MEHHILFPKCWAFGKVPWIRMGLKPTGNLLQKFPKPKDVPHSSGFDLSLKLQGWCGHFGILDGAVVQVGCSCKKMRN